MAEDRLTEAKKALVRYEDRNSKPNPAHLADAVRGLIALVEATPTPVAAAVEASRRWPHTPHDPAAASARSVRRLTFRQGARWALAHREEKADASPRGSSPRCRHCGGAGFISVSKDPDEIADCVCADRPKESV